MASPADARGLAPPHPGPNGPADLIFLRSRHHRDHHHHTTSPHPHPDCSQVLCSPAARAREARRPLSSQRNAQLQPACQPAHRDTAFMAMAASPQISDECHKSLLHTSTSLNTTTTTPQTKRLPPFTAEANKPEAMLRSDRSPCGNPSLIQHTTHQTFLGTPPDFLWESQPHPTHQNFLGTPPDFFKRQHSSFLFSRFPFHGDA
eukprot:scaffold4841_cov121-Isochrysis_galbana.AAC.14